MKKFLYKDKTGRGYNAIFTDVELYTWENEQDWYGEWLHEYIEEAEEGDKWENHASEIICFD